jgi:hypothetical protein
VDSLTWTEQRARVAALVKHHPNGSPELDAARAELAELAEEKYIDRIVAEAPEFSPAQKTA